MSTLIYLSSSPYNGTALKEALDLALVFGTFEQAISIAITGDALALLIEEQAPSTRHGKHLHKLLDGLEFYDIEQVFVKATETSALPVSLWPGITALNTDAWLQMLDQHQHIYRF
ncbi:Protein TusC [Marinomonas aquimarina]|uniref:Protein TusC n=1 Tax=Marinomonas aquimarina TaxID=295068 RepID=A0A1A8T491_9GAMM|nr:DsrE family protein [Marinomonas aquimarina]SBS26742.1 Protein TusC [Marinomonas aquimarina]